MSTITSIYVALMLTACGGLAADDTTGALTGFTFCTFAGAAIIYQNLKRQA